MIECPRVPPARVIPKAGVLLRHRAYLCLIQLGRTIRTFREAVDIESAKWKTFRRQLKPDDRERLDKIFDHARMHADSGTVISIPHKIDVVFMSVLIEMQRRIEELESTLSRS